MGTSHWFLDQNHLFILFLHFTPRGTTNNLHLLNTQNRPNLIYSLSGAPRWERSTASQGHQGEGDLQPLRGTKVRGIYSLSWAPRWEGSTVGWVDFALFSIFMYSKGMLFAVPLGTIRGPTKFFWFRFKNQWEVPL